jgi:hypothetical protein
MTIDEIKLITFVVVALLVGSTAKYHRGRQTRSESTPLPHAETATYP